MNMRISVIGTGYLGVTHAACMAELGFEVVGVDTSAEKVACLAAGSVPFSEPDLEEMVARHVASGRLRFTTDLRLAAQVADVHFICVGTPQSKDGLAADTTAVFTSATALAQHVTRDCLIVGKSTVPVGTAAVLAEEVRAVARPGVSVSVAWNPEFLREGHAVQDTLRPDRLVLGVTSPDAELTLRRVYESAIAAGVAVHVTDPATAELAKTAANAFLATKISFINAMAEISDRADADVVALAAILGDDPRIGRRFLDSGIGFGGGCLPKDIRAFSARASELGVPTLSDLLAQVDAINLGARKRAVDLAAELCGPQLRGSRVAVLGAAFKPLSDDVRDSPALDIAAQLHARGAEVRIYDPEANRSAQAAYPFLTYVGGVEAAVTGADVVLHLTEWPEFAHLDAAGLGRLVRRRQIVDGRNKLDPEPWVMAGWTFRGLGRRTPSVFQDLRPSVAGGAAVTASLQESILEWT